MFAKGHVQPHHNNVPRRRHWTQSQPRSSHVEIKAPSILPLKAEKAQPSGGPTATTRSTISASTADKGQEEHRSPATPLTCPSGEILLADALLDTHNKISPSSPHPRLGNAQGAIFGGDPPFPVGTPSPLVPSKTAPKDNVITPPHPTTDSIRGHLQPHVTNVPRRLSRAHKEKSRVRRRCLQELIAGSGVWMAFDLRSGGEGDDGDVSAEEPTIEEKSERDWMWEPRFGFAGVIRVRVGKTHASNHGVELTRRKHNEKEMELIIEKGKAMAMYDDSGTTALTDSQLEDAAHLIIKCRRMRQGKMDKVLLMVPPSRPVEAISIALFSLSLPSTSTATSIRSINSSSGSTTPSHASSAYLSQLRFLPGILELERSGARNDDNTPNDDAQVEVNGAPGSSSQYTLIQLALWHLHDLPTPAISDLGDCGQDAGLKAEWRGVLSLAGIERLERLRVSSQ